MLFNVVAFTAMIGLVIAAPAASSTSTRPHASTSTSKAVAAPTTSTSTTATPTASPCPVDNGPFVLRSLKAFTAAPGSKNQSFISFHLQDSSPGLALSIMCKRTLAKGSTDSVEDSSNYYLCDNEDVQFMYDGKTVTIERTYTNACIGAWPWDSTTYWGQATTNMQETSQAAGKMASQAHMVVHITEEYS